MAMTRMRPLILLAALMLLATACIKVDYHITVNADSSGTVDGTIAIAEAMMELAEASGDGGCEEFASDELAGELPPGAQVTPFEEEGWCGITFTASLANFGSLSGDSTATPIEIKVVGDVMYIELDTSDMAADQDEDMSPEEMQMFMDMLNVPESEFKIRVTLPGEPLENNADSVDGSTFTWNLDLFGDDIPLSLQASADLSAPETVAVPETTVAPATTTAPVAPSGDDGGSSSTILIVVVVVLLIVGIRTLKFGLR